MNDYQLVLASQSPRRKKILEKAGFRFMVYPSKLSEIPQKNLTVEEQILDLARQKARAVFERLKNELQEPYLVLGSDTEVIFGGRTLGKPADGPDAYRILKSLSGQVHTVITAIWFVESKSGQEAGAYELSQVQFKELSDEKIWDYIKTGDPMDKAGAYGIQGPGWDLIEKFEGNFENIMGLPIEKVKSLITEKNWKIL